MLHDGPSVIEYVISILLEQIGAIPEFDFVLCLCTRFVCCVMYHSVTRQPVGCAHISDLAETIYYLGISIAQRRKFVSKCCCRMTICFYAAREHMKNSAAH